MKLLVALMLVGATLALPAGAARGELDVDMPVQVALCGNGSVINRVQYCVDRTVDWAQEVAHDLYCDLACP